MKKITLFGRTIPALVAVLVTIGLASAGLLTYYGMVVATVDVKQSILLDEQDYTAPITDGPFHPAPGGEKFCFKHWLKNQMSVEGTVEFDSEVTGPCSGLEKSDCLALNCVWDEQECIETGITTEYYDLSDHELSPITQGYGGYGGGLFDFTQVIPIGSTDYFGWEPLLITKSHDSDCNLIITIEAPEGIYEPPENFGLPFDVNGDGVMDWQIQYHADPASEDRDFNWAFSELIDSVYTKDMLVEGKRQWSPLPDGITATEDENKKVFTIKIDSDKLGNNNGRKDDCGLSYKFGLSMVENDKGYPESWSGEAVIIVFPDPGFDWFESSGLEEETLGTEIADTLTLETGEEMLFCNCYDFDELIAPGTYTITTTVLP